MTTELKLINLTPTQKGIIHPDEAEKLASKEGVFCYFKSNKHKVIAFTDIKRITNAEIPVNCSHTHSLMPRQMHKRVINSVLDYRLEKYADFTIVTSVKEFNDIINGEDEVKPVVESVTDYTPS